jgi:hypothetical protein
LGHRLYELDFRLGQAIDPHFEEAFVKQRQRFGVGVVDIGKSYLWPIRVVPHDRCPFLDEEWIALGTFNDGLQRFRGDAGLFFDDRLFYRLPG